MTDHDTSASQNIKYPHWQREFEAALLEGNPQKLRQLGDAAEAAIFLRSQALVESPQGHAEQQAISDAMQASFWAHSFAAPCKATSALRWS
jgi:hypothetical protein